MLHPMTQLGIARERRGFTALELANFLTEMKLLRITEQRLFRIESGRTQPTPAEISILSKVLGVDPQCMVTK